MKKPYIKSLAVLAISLGLFSCGDSYKMTAAEEKELEKLAEILDNSPSANELNRMLISASKKGFANVVETLIEHGAYVDHKEDSERYTSLMWAAGYNRVDVVRVLIRKGADVDSMSSKKNTPLGIAISKSNKEIVEMLIDAGADVNLKVMEYRFSLLYLAVLHRNLEIVKLLVDAGVNVNETISWDGNDYTPLMVNASQGNVDIAEYLISKGADVNAKNPKSGETALDVAIRKYNTRVADVLRSNGAVSGN